MFQRRSLLAVFPLLLILFAAGCSPAQAPAALTPTHAAAGTATSSPGSVPVTASTAAVTRTPSPQDTPPANNPLKAANSCNLINSSDLAHLFPPHNEIVRDQPKTGPVDHPPFSDTLVPGSETSCLFYDFHQPGKVTGWMLQVTYKVDVPDQSAIPAWNKAWEAAKAQSSQPVSGLGDAAFNDGANLYIKLGNTYLSFESTDTHLDPKSPAGIQQLQQDNLQLAQAALKRLQ